jgi:hypothetical protein
MYKVKMRNIEGFRGEYSFAVEDGLNVIIAKYNGAGKTTFFDCIKVLCDKNFVASDEIKYMLNIDSTECDFSVEVDGDTFGFFYNGKHLVYYRCYAGSVREVSQYPFEDIAQRLGIFIVDGSAVNICDRFIDFLSGSKSSDFSALYKLMQNKELDELESLIFQSIGECNKEYEKAYAVFEQANRRLYNMPHYPQSEEYRSALDSIDYETKYYMLNVLQKQIDRYKAATPKIAETQLVYISELVIVCDYRFIKHLDVENCIELMNFVLHFSDMLNSCNIIKCIEITSINIINISNIYEYTAHCSLHGDVIDSSSLELYGGTRCLIQEYKVSKKIDSILYKCLQKLIVLYADVTTMLKNDCTLDEEQSLITGLKVELTPYQFSCPMGREVYLINGKCLDL